jgi:hypothetical protein
MSLLFCSEGNTRYEEINNKIFLEKIAEKFLKKLSLSIHYKKLTESLTHRDSEAGKFAFF